MNNDSKLFAYGLATTIVGCDMENEKYTNRQALSDALLKPIPDLDFNDLITKTVRYVVEQYNKLGIDPDEIKSAIDKARYACQHGGEISEVEMALSKMSVEDIEKEQAKTM